MAGELALMARQAATLYRLDREGRLLAVNEAGEPPAPRLFIGRTWERNLWHTRHDLPEELSGAIDALIAREPPPVNLRDPLRCDGEVRALLEAHAPITGVWFGPAWWCPPQVAARQPLATARLTEPTALQRHFPGWARDFATSQPCVAVLDDDDAVAVCCSSRVSSVAAEAGANTLEGYRRRGYAAAAVAGWAEAVREDGRIPLYSTSWENVASQGVARALGLIPYGADLSFA